MGIAERREREKRQRREAIVDAAEKVFFTKGFENSSMDEIAEAAELSKGTLYLYFQSKDDLYYAITYRGLCFLYDLVEENYRDEKNGLGNLTQIGRAYFDFYKKRPDYYQAILHHEIHDNGSGIEGDGGRPSTALCNEMSHKLYRRIHQIVEGGIADGSIRDDLGTVKLSIILWGLFTGLMHVIAQKAEVLKKYYAEDTEVLLEEAIGLIKQTASRQ
jgi:TetR/AcrR family transcriptional regulator